jgi:hypothetical protein
MLIRLTHTRPSLCLEPDAHVRISANDVAWSACQSESHSSSSSCMCQPYKHGVNYQMKDAKDSIRFLLVLPVFAYQAIYAVKSIGFYDV